MTDAAISDPLPRQPGLIRRLLAIIATLNNEAWGYVAGGQHAAEHYGYRYTKLLAVQDWFHGICAHLGAPLRAKMRERRRIKRFNVMVDMEVMHLYHTLEAAKRGLDAAHQGTNGFPATEEAIEKAAVIIRDDLSLVIAEYDIRYRRACTEGWGERWEEMSNNVRKKWVTARG